MPALVVMGVSGCGKSEVGRASARALGWTMVEGDAYHPPANVARMRDGVPLTDADRQGWLKRLAGVLAGTEPILGTPAETGPVDGIVLSCSALRRSYRELLRAGHPHLRFAFLSLEFDAALARVSHRPGHFFSPSLVADQFRTLEPPTGEEGVLTLDASRPIAALARVIADWVRAPSFDGSGPSAVPPPAAPSHDGSDHE